MKKIKNENKQKINVEELIKRIEDKIKKLEKDSFKSETTDSTDCDLDKIIKEIDQKIMALENDNSLDVDDLNDKINSRIEAVSASGDEEELDKTIYDLKEISKNVGSTIKELEKKKKEKKRKKAMYCDMARKKEKQKKNNK